MWGKAHCQHVEENNCSLTQTLSDVTFIMQTGPAVSKEDSICLARVRSKEDKSKKWNRRKKYYSTEAFLNIPC